MRVAGAIELVLVFIIIIAASGCAPFPEAQRAKSSGATSDALAAVPLSEPLGLQAQLIDDCDEELALKALFSATDVSLENAHKIWAQCQVLYACSPTTQAFLKESFLSGETFKLGFTDLKAANVSILGERVSALYVSNSGKIYVDTSVRTVARACPLLLHELVHRFDPNANPGSESLEAEFKAYWYQEVFGHELVLRGDPFDTVAREYVHWKNRETLLSDVAKMYGFSADRSVLEQYGPLPFENASLTATHSFESEANYIVD